jgi:hypothetical protein
LSTALCNTDKDLVRTAGVAFLRAAEPGFADKWFLMRDQEAPAVFDLNTIYRAAEDPDDVPLSVVPSQILSSYKRYKKQFNKRSFVAGGLSAVVPGLGKLYAGKPRSALMTFLLHCGYAAQTIESARKLGNKHPLTIINVSAFGVFYLANIYGSFMAVKDLKREYKKQFVYDATSLYN